MSDTREAAAEIADTVFYHNSDQDRRNQLEGQLNNFADALRAEWQSTRDTSPAPATVTDEMCHAFWKNFKGSDQNEAYGWTRNALLAAVGPALARLAALEKLEQRAKADLAWRSQFTDSASLTAIAAVRDILTGSDAEKGKT